jgi:hypothetical protein
MKILFITPNPPAPHGIGFYSAMLRGELLAQGYDVPPSKGLTAVPAPRHSA